MSQSALQAVNHKAVLALALPMILSNITSPLLGLVDTAVIGHMDQPYYLGGVAVGSMIITLIFWLMGFLRMATTGKVAQSFGANDSAAQIQLLAQGLMVALVIAFGILLLQWPIWQLAHWLAGASAEVSEQAQRYFEIRVWASPMALVNLVLMGWLLGRQKSKLAMYAVILTNCLNLTLDLWFVIGLGWGVAGVAWASLLAETGSMLLLLWFTRGQLRSLGETWLGTLQKYAKLAGLGSLLALNRDIFIRSACLQAVFSFMTFQGARLGDIPLAANAILLNFLMLISYALDGFAYSAEAQVGRAYGQGENQALNKAVRLNLIWGFGSALIFSLAFGLFGSALIHLMTGISEVREYALTYLPWVVALPLLSFLCYLMDGIYIGAAKGQQMRDSMIFSAFVVFFPLWWLMSDLGNTALWAALSVFMLARGISLYGHYRWRLARGGFISR
ncbi:MATE family efflux transporter [Paraferrimonas sedimenticola]|uniref:MATE family efflux transporter n=1 Tax=Paraferrimonas sedimenticola TaxID=375674 RepID=A0AA37RVF0_9GAMM|nr:MATE family efflux transporter [Paraferrimonas sedimenticola]GLP95948.1 MATE family efflux transporter [Paraferrimonas sedimenticola]